MLFEKHLQDLPLKHYLCKKELLITRNFNINLLDFENISKVQSFLNLIFRFEMTPVFNKPARVTRCTASATDHMFKVLLKALK